MELFYVYFRVQSLSANFMCEIFLRWNVFVRLYAFKLKDHISIGNCRCKCGSCQILNRVVELEGVCLPKLTVSKNNEAVEAAEGLAEPPLCITQHPGFHAVCLNHWVLQTA